MNLVINLLVALTSCFPQQDELKKGIQLKQEYRYAEALPIFQKLLKSDSSNTTYLENTSICYTKVGNTLTDPQQKFKNFQTGLYLAIKALKTNIASADAHYSYALALGRINENASTKEKIANAKKIKSELDLTIKLNPKHGGAYHILGRWHSTVADFGGIEKLAINTLFGGVPQGGSFEEAEKCFLNAIKLEPKYKLHYYELANTYFEIGKKEHAKVFLLKALEIPQVNEEDKNTDIKSKELLKKL